MQGLLRIAAYAVLAACGWTVADGLRRAGAGEPFARARIPWDADRMPLDAPDARLLALRPVSPFARFRDALSRADGADGDAFRTAARGVLRWGRNQPGTLLDTGGVALARWKRTGEAADREVGEALLVEYARRTTHAEYEGLRVWLRYAAPQADPFTVFQDAPATLWAAFGEQLSATHPAAAWRFLEPDLRAGNLDPRYAEAVVALARIRWQPSDLAVLKALAGRGDVAPETAARLRAVIADLEGIR